MSIEEKVAAFQRGYQEGLNAGIAVGQGILQAAGQYAVELQQEGTNKKVEEIMNPDPFVDRGPMRTR